MTKAWFDYLSKLHILLMNLVKSFIPDFDLSVMQRFRGVPVLRRYSLKYQVAQRKVQMRNE
jgi:hypothetical protein